MLDLLDGPLGKNDWGTIDWANGEIKYDESGTTKPFLTSDIIFTRGKYAGLLLSEVTDTWYLKFISEKNSDDYLITYSFKIRLGELTL